ncbi:deoxyribodipyrimidine photolyase-related protein [Motilibacter rhizosphaerae]|uniref:Deoxyribodipyrimidine photolyase-related protein n=1 Tax=Motilibacter rhizosphaerae TaxID=598652 RepID=A0A4Q7NTP0_9ACTN|nr:cryptochrome/photolyase family protein [Motilibacter rhizosphaerae]RZS90260.1 deoxyribodipyrimidine photolyase-related protein [Motilibacter rhizosphaerae]
MERRWLFADQLGPHFLDADDQPVLLVESRAVFARRRFHRQKAHLVLSALRHRAAELGEQARFVRTEGGYRRVLEALGEPVSVCAPTTRGALRLVESLPGVDVLPERGFATTRAEFERWAQGRTTLRMEQFYRDARTRLGLLMEPDGPVGGRWNYDAENREAPPRTDRLDLAPPWLAEEDEIDAEVRADLDRWERDGVVSFVGRDGPRVFPVTRAEAVEALRVFVTQRLASFGPVEDAMLRADEWMAHSLLSPAMNLGLLHPVECARSAERAYRRGEAPLPSVEGYVRQLVGWRDYVFHTYWHFDEDYPDRNALEAYEPLPQWFRDLDADAVEAACLRDVLAGVRDRGWVHHIPRLMVLGGYALQRGWSPQELTAWFHECFVDGYAWVMVANVIGMSQHADGGLMATKPYAAGGAYIDRMSDYCGGCAYSPKVRLGHGACPYTAGYWAFLDRNAERLAGNVRMRQPLAGLARLADREAVVEQERERGSRAP